MSHLLFTQPKYEQRAWLFYIRVKAHSCLESSDLFNNGLDHAGVVTLTWGRIHILVMKKCCVMFRANIYLKAIWAWDLYISEKRQD